MKRKIILIVLVLLLNVLWINTISFTNSLASHYKFVIHTKEKANLTNATIIDDIDVMLENNLSYEDVDAVVIGNKINTLLKGELAGYGELISKYSIVNEVNPYLVAAMIVENAECDETCSVLVTKCHNIGKTLYNKDSIGETACFGGYYRNFKTIEDSIKTYIKYIKTNFYEKEKTTPSTIYSSYRKDVRWVFRVNSYMEQMKNAIV